MNIVRYWQAAKMHKKWLGGQLARLPVPMIFLFYLWYPGLLFEDYQSGVLRGFCFGTKTSLLYLVVHPYWRKKGIASQLLKRYASWCCPWVFVDFPYDNPDARGFYEKHHCRVLSITVNRMAHAILPLRQEEK